MTNESEDEAVRTACRALGAALSRAADGPGRGLSEEDERLIIGIVLLVGAIARSVPVAPSKGAA